MLTPRQKQVLDFVTSYTKKRGFAPSLEDIRKRLRLSSVSNIHQHIETLRKKGYLEKQKNQRRSIEISKPERLVKVPLLGTIAAGEPIHIFEEQRETIAVPKSKIPYSSEVYALRVVGSSMIDENINDGDVVLVRQQATAENGQKVVALIDNHEATLKKFYRERGHIRLQPANKNMELLIFRNGRDFSIQGIVLDVIREEGSAEIQLPEYKKTEKYKELPLNKIICGDAVEVLRKIPSNSVDLVVTSPPYDDIRTYNGFSLNLPAIGKELHRVLKDGGIVAMVIQDATRNFGKTLTSFKTIIDWCDNAGFKLFETSIVAPI